jgi:hypothetical protein
LSIQHAALEDPQIHEPKGASTATAGQVWVSDGAGSGAFSDTFENVHGQMNILSNTTALTLVAAADATLNTNTDYQKVTGAGGPWVNTYTHNISFTTSDSLTLTRGGYYIVSFWASIKVASTNNFIGVKYGINGSLSTQKLVTQSSSANDRRNLSAVAIVGPVTANDVLSMHVAGTIGTAITFEDAGLMAAYIHA